ncbi:MAG: ATP-binding cassette domain-containing protein [Nocardioidaceae bacterium]
MGDTLLRVTDLTKTFSSPTGDVRAVRGVSLELTAGSTVGIVGESGSGKTTTGFCILRLTQPTSGSVVFDGEEITTLDRRRLRHKRRDMQIVFQDPYSSLDPRMTAAEIVLQPLRVHGIGTPQGRRTRVRDLFELVGLSTEAADKQPREFSGGQRQRIGIARALALNPKLVVCDEPVSALDVSIQAQIVNLLRDIQRELGLSYLFISHDLAVVRAMSDQIYVMRSGEVVERGAAQDVFTRPQHEYTKSLLGAVPVPDPALMARRRATRWAARASSPMGGQK